MNPYATMWLFVFFDLPVKNKTQRKKAARFRVDLEKDGFTMMQYSLYRRWCATRNNAETHINRIRQLAPDVGRISILMITDKQYGDMVNIWNGDRHANEPVELFTLF